MLTLDLVRIRSTREGLKCTFVDPKQARMVEKAAAILHAFATNVGNARSAVDEALVEVEGDASRMLLAGTDRSTLSIEVAAAALEPAALSSHPTVLIARARADAALRAELRALTDHLGTPPHTTPAPQP